MRAWKLRARTLIELLVSMSLLLVITAACGMALRSSIQYYRRVEAQSEMENQLIVSLGLLSREVGEAGSRSFLWEPAPGALTFASPRGSDGRLQVDHSSGNTLLFSTMVHYVLDPGTGDFRRFVEPIAPPRSLAPDPLSEMTPPRDAAYFAVPGISNRRLAKGMTHFELQAIKLNKTTSAEQAAPDLMSADIFRVRLRFERQFDRLYGVESQLDLVPKN